MTRISTSPFGLEAWLEATRIMLPLRGMEICADIFSGFARVEIDQVYVQSNNQPLDFRYVFPLPADAAVHRCEMHVNGRVVLARVEALAVAEELYKKAKEAGHRAALARGERENLFTLELGNLQPGDVILMKLAYIQPLQRLQDQRSFRVPTSVGVRFVPGKALLRPNSGNGAADDTDEVPDASRISPPTIDGDHPDAPTLNVNVRLLGGTDNARAVSSPSHILAVRPKENDLHVSLAADHEFPDKDFVMTWFEPAPDALVARTWLDENRRGVLELRLPIKESSSSPACDVYFLLDRSGSMAGENWAGACRAMAGLKSRLDLETPVWLTVFETNHRDWAEKPLAARNLDFGLDGSEIERIGTGGGTNMLEALAHVAGKVKKHSAGRSAAILILTDGQIGNEEAVVSCAQEAGCPVHVVGIAITPNDALRAVAEETGGRVVFLSPGDDIPAAVGRYAPLLRPPVVRELSMPAGWEAADGRSLQDLTPGEDLVIPVSATPEAPELSLAGISSDGSLWSSIPTREDCKPAGLIWARARIRHLERRSDQGALALAKEFNLLCKSAAFVAWDEAEKVVIAKKEIEQPTVALYARPRSQAILASPCSPRIARFCAPPPPRILESLEADCMLLARGNSPRSKDVSAAGGWTSAELLEFLETQAQKLLLEVCGMGKVPQSILENLRRLKDLATDRPLDFQAKAAPLLAEFLVFFKGLAKKHPKFAPGIKELLAIAKECRKRVAAAATATR